jgi:dynein heavy chain
LRDVSKVIQGILMTRPVSIQSPETITKLWVNECMRVFHDRLINEEDKSWFKELIMDQVKGAFRTAVEEDEMFGTSKVMFGDLLKLEAPVQLYEEIKDQNKLKKILIDMLDDYNMGSSNKMNLVFFEDAILHILRICRVLRQPRGNIMLIGVGGSGKQSLTKLSSHMLEMKYK